MTVAVAHQPSVTGRLVLQEAAKEASLRSTDLVVIHVVDNVDADVAAANEAGISDAVGQALSSAGAHGVRWRLHLVPGGNRVVDVAGSVMDAASSVAAEILVIGARRRSPVGKALMGSVTQSILLDCDVPVLVVKAAR